MNKTQDGWQFVTVHIRNASSISFWVAPDENIQATSWGIVEREGLNAEEIHAYDIHDILPDGTPTREVAKF
jgi:hypothetical protein